MAPLRSCGIAGGDMPPLYIREIAKKVIGRSLDAMQIDIMEPFSKFGNLLGKQFAGGQEAAVWLEGNTLQASFAPVGQRKQDANPALDLRGKSIYSGCLRGCNFSFGCSRLPARRPSVRGSATTALAAGNAADRQQSAAEHERAARIVQSITSSPQHEHGPKAKKEAACAEVVRSGASVGSRRLLRLSALQGEAAGGG